MTVLLILVRKDYREEMKWIKLITKDLMRKILNHKKLLNFHNGKIKIRVLEVELCKN